MVRKKRSAAYRFTIDLSSEVDAKRLRRLRREAAQANKGKGLRALGRLRVSLSPRLGIDNPHAWKYDNRFNPRLRLEDAAEADVYVSFVPKTTLRRSKSRART